MSPEDAAQERANEYWYTLPKDAPSGHRIALTIIAVRDMGLPTAHLKFMGGGGPDDWEYWEDEGQA